jgi:ADP-ribose pyrophosphatase YjhB (NUDIX family)
MHDEYEFKFCPVCGGHLNPVKLKAYEPSRLVCSECSFIFYLDPKLVACSLLELDEKIVLLKRSIEPEKGKWVIPGGYVDRGEEVKAAAIRETEEECGIKVRLNDLLGVYSYGGRIVVVVVYLAEYLSGTMTIGDESLDVGLYGPHEIPWEELAFPSTRDALRDYCRKIETP